MRRSALLLVPVLAAAALVAVVALAGARPDTASPLAQVASAPERFAGEDVRVSGRIVAGAPGSELLILEGTDGRRLLLRPPDGAQPAPGVRVAVRGRVELLVNDLAASAGTSALVHVRTLAARPG